MQVYDLQNGQQVACFQAADDTVNGVSFSRSLPLLATASGHRRYPLLPEDGWEDTTTPADSPAAGSSRSISAVGSGAQHQKGPAAASLSMSSICDGGSCNSLRLWRLAADWVPVSATAAGGSNDAAMENADVV